jgi:phage terminase large subunit-like protein
VEIGRKNGESSLAAGVALVLLFLDNEPGAEILCLASDVDQARVVFGECKRLMESSPDDPAGVRAHDVSRCDRIRRDRQRLEGDER